METSTPSRVDQVISDLELLKIKIASVTARYNILKEDYSRLCEDAIASIVQYSSAPEAEETALTNPVKTAVEDFHQSPEAVAFPVPEPPEVHLAGCPSGDTVIPLSEKRKATEKPAESALASVKSVEGLEVRTSRAPSLEEIIAFQHRQLHAKPQNKKAAGKKVNAQAFVDIIGDGIENGLDKLGNGLMFPFAKIADLSHKPGPADTSSRH